MPHHIPIRTLLTGAALAAAGADLPDAVRQAGATRSTSFPAEIGTWSKAACEAAGQPAVQHAPGENSIDVCSQIKHGRTDDAVQGSGTPPCASSNEPSRRRILGAPLTLGYQGLAFRQDGAARREAVTDLWIAAGEQTAANSLRHGRGPA